MGCVQYKIPKLRFEELPVAPPTVTRTPFEARPGMYTKPPLTLGFPSVMVSVDLFVAYRSIRVSISFLRRTEPDYRLIVKI
jgi:hypothetical protein